jgi:predicted transcriptional regulator
MRMLFICSNPFSIMTFVKEFGDDAFLNALSLTETKTTSEVSKIVGCSKRLVEYRLDKLAAGSKVVKEKVKASGRFGFIYVWKLNEEMA